MPHGKYEIQLEEYRKVARLFSELRNACCGKDKGLSIKRIERTIKEYTDDNARLGFPLGVLGAVQDAIRVLDKYNQNDLEYLINAGFNIDRSVVYASGWDYLNKAEEFVPYLKKINESSKKFMEENDDYMKMFARILRAYADISEYEAKAIDKLKTEAFEKILIKKKKA